jgi:carbonic anhydrase
MKHRLTSLVGSAMLVAAVVTAASAAPPAPASNLAPEDALNELKQGNQRFTSATSNACADTRATVAQLAKGQAPNTIVLSCSDSRVPPELVFDQKPGRIFTVRVAGNILNAEAIASIEYAISHLGSQLILVLGHESCGAVKAALETPAGTSAGSPSLDHLVSEIRSNLGNMPKPPDAELRAPVIKNVDAVAKQLVERSAIIRDAVKPGRVRIERGIYDISSGKVEVWE